MPKITIIAAPSLPPKPKDFFGTDAEWRTLNLQNPAPPPASSVPTQQQAPQPTHTPLPELAPKKVEPKSKEKAPPVIKPNAAPDPKNVPLLEGDEVDNVDSSIPEWLGSEDDWSFIGEKAPPGVLPISNEENDLVPSELGRGKPGLPSDPEEIKDITDEEFIKIKPEEETPVDPATLFDEVLPPDTPMEERNRQFNIREKLWYSLNNRTPMTITYETLPDRMSRTFVSTRMIEPDYVYWAGTNRHILVAWDHLRNDWRAFVVDRIREANLEGEDQ